MAGVKADDGVCKRYLCEIMSIHNRFEKFKISYGATDNYLCRLISAKC